MRDGRHTGAFWRAAQQFLDLKARLADVPHPCLGILFQAAGQQPAKTQWRRRW